MKKIKEIIVKLDEIITYKRLLITCIIIISFKIGIGRGIFKTNNQLNDLYSIETVVDSNYLKLRDLWVDVIKVNKKWDYKKQFRLDKLSNNIFFKKDISMKPFINIDGKTVTPLAYTVYNYDPVSYIVYPSKIVMSDKVTFDSLGASIILMHELGHGILLLDDVYDNYNGQIMWFMALRTYSNFSDESYFSEKITEQINSPEDKSIRENIIEKINKSSNKNQTNKKIIIALSNEYEHIHIVTN